MIPRSRADLRPQIDPFSVPVRATTGKTFSFNAKIILAVCLLVCIPLAIVLPIVLTRNDTNSQVVAIDLVQVGERVPLSNNIHTEPHKVSRFVADYNISECVTWKSKFVFSDDEIDDGRSFEDEKEVCNSNEYEVTLTHPGSYEISLTSDEYEGKTTFRNIYVRREVRNLTATEWNDYVDAVLTLKNTTTEDGRTLYDCADYYEYDFFVLFHGFYSANKTCDQLHFSMMQELGHEAWTGMFEKSLQCVNPSISLHYWDEDADIGVYGENIKNSPVFSDDYYGNGIQNPNGVVDNGKFKNFPIRQTRLNLCELLDATDTTECVAYINNFGAWLEPDPSAGGFVNMQPRALNDLQLVSRKTGYVLGENTNFITETAPTTSFIMNELCNRQFDEALASISSDNIHGWFHHSGSGLWGNNEVEIFNIIDTAVTNGQTTLRDAVRVFAWPQDARMRFDGCITCTTTECTCVVKDGCDDDDILTPSDSFDVQDKNYSENSMWKAWLDQTRGSYVSQRKALFGCQMVEGGSFDRSAVANIDPFFYVHHVYTFAVVDLAKRLTSDSGPVYGLDRYSEEECGGHKLDDTTVFSNLVPYRNGQNIGDKHTWRDILYQWEPERRHYRYDYRNEVTKSDC